MLVSSSCRVASKTEVCSARTRVVVAEGRQSWSGGPAIQGYVAVGEVIRGDGGERKALGLCLDSAQVLPDWPKM